MAIDIDSEWTSDDDYITVETEVTVSNLSEVDSTHSTADFHSVTRELVEGEVEETRIDDISGSFLTEASRSSVTISDTDGISHFEEHPYTWPGPGPGASSSIEVLADESFHDERHTTNLMTAEQSGGYGNEETATSSSEISLTFIDEFFSEMEGDIYWSDGDTEMITEYSSEQTSDKTYTSSTSEDYSAEGNEGTWSTSYSFENSWNYHTAITIFGYTTNFDDVGDDDGSENSGPQSYTPDNNPSDFYSRIRPWQMIVMSMGGDPPTAGDATGGGTGGAEDPPAEGNGPGLGHLLGALNDGLASAASSIWNAMSGGAPTVNGLSVQGVKAPEIDINYDPDAGREKQWSFSTGISAVDDYFYYLRNPGEMDTDLEVGFYVAAGTATVAAAGAAIVVTFPCAVAGGTAGSAGFGSASLTGTALGSSIQGAGIAGTMSVANNLMAGRNAFSNAPANILLGALSGRLGHGMGNTGMGMMGRSGLIGAIEGGVSEFLNGGSLLDIVTAAGRDGAMSMLLMGALSKVFRCFARDTIVWTTEGPKQIGEVRPGEKVRAYHFDIGEWVHATVLERSDTIYEGPVVSIEVGGSKIETTVYHPFWVVEGQNLDERAVPKELLPEEDEGKSLNGRWVNSHELRAGDKIYSLSGKLETIKAVSQRFEVSFAVCNLEIAELHNYAVGYCGVLVHNNAACGGAAVAEAVENGVLSVVSRLSRLIRGSVDEQHHIFMQGRRSWFMKRYGLDVDKYVAKIPKDLHDALHAGREAFGKYGWYGSALLDEIARQEKLLRRKLSLDELLGVGRSMAKRFGFGEVPWNEYVR